VSVNEVFICFV